MTLQVVRTVAELHQALESSCRSHSIGFVPTMGALHRGHAALLHQSARENQVTVLSIFVNPLQFGPNEDFARYPRTFEADVELARTSGTQIVFCPNVEDVYPPGFSTHVEETEVSQPLCGATRPGHFKGVCTVVLRLLNLVRPNKLYLGQKDLQQCLVLSRMVRDLGVPVEVITVPTVREPDGLALSSRNRYLSPVEREVAPLIYRALLHAQHLVQSTGVRNVQDVLAECHSLLAQNPQFSVEYLELRSLPNLALPAKIDGQIALAVAVRLRSTRLIDNIIITAT